MSLLRYFCDTDPANGNLFSSGVEYIKIFDFAWANNPSVIRETFLRDSGGGLSIVDLDEAHIGSGMLFARGLLYIDDNATEENISVALQEDAIDGIGVQSFVRSGAMIPDDNAWAVWFSHFFDIAAIGFLSKEKCHGFMSRHTEIPIISADDAIYWVNSWKSPEAKRCFLEYIEEGRLAI